MTCSKENAPVVLTVNGQRHELTVDPGRSLLDVLREDLSLTGAKKACDVGECGSCIVLFGEKGVMSCLLPVARAQAKEITTIEGLAPSAPLPIVPENDASRPLHALQEAFLEKGATQCGFCIPGMIMEARALLSSKPDPTREDVVKRLSRNLCRCTGYVKIIEAVLRAAEILRDGKRPTGVEGGDGRVIGASVDRLDSPDTVDGKAMYAADLKMAGMLYSRVLRSPHHHARIISIDTADARAMPGVEAVITAADIPGSNALPNCQPQTYVFPLDRVRFLGEAVAAVAATSGEIAEEALKRIRVEYEPLPAALYISDAMKDGAVPLFPPGPNVSPATVLEEGDVETGFEKADVLVEKTYTTNRWEHAAMEPEAALAYEDESGRIVIHAPLYHPFVQGQESIAANLGVASDRVRIICPAMGGNFGKRGDALAATLSALLAFKTKKPVRIVYTREESMLGSSKSPPVHISYKTGATRDGKLVAMEAEVLHGTGTWAPHLSPHSTRGAELCQFGAVPTMLLQVTGPYHIPNIRVRAYDVVTNGPRSVPLRGTSGPYLAFALDSQMDLMAAGLGIDPLDFRLRNALGVGSRIHVGQVMKESIGIKAELEALRPPYRDARNRARIHPHSSAGPWKRGVGIGCGWRHITHFSMDPFPAAVELLEDGRVRILAGTVEQGQGATTEFAQIVSQEIGVPMESIVPTLGDTFLAPYPVPTFSSITTVVTGTAVHNAAKRLEEALVETAARILKEDPKTIVIEGGRVFSALAPEEELNLRLLAGYMRDGSLPLVYEASCAWKGYEYSDDGRKTPNILYGFNAGLAEVEVNVETGQVRILKLFNACDPGTVINPLALEGQVEGGTAFGLGFALKEAFHPDRPPTLKAYGLATTRDMPDEIIPIFVEEPCSSGPFGAKSAGEMPVIAPLPAIINAIANATGARVFDIPATPDKVLEALGRK